MLYILSCLLLCLFLMINFCNIYLSLLIKTLPLFVNKYIPKRFEDYKYHKNIRRTIKRDSMYSWSKCIKKDDTAIKWIQENQNKLFFIVQQTKEKNLEHLTLISDEIEKLFNADLLYKKLITNLPSFD